MTAHALTRTSKALTLVPLALLSGAWTLSLVGTSATAASEKNHDLPDGTAVPSQAIEAPASVPVAGIIAPGVPKGTADQVVAGSSTSGIPAPALVAYQRAAQIIDAADKSCNIPWELIAAIGRVESDNGQYGGNTLTAKGISTPGIYGPELNGKNGTALIRDTDGGLIDHDPVYDRAVGPMQFIPSTWAVVKVDADGDGKRNPQDINDASLATAVYLCSGTENLATHQGQETAVFRYNHSRAYVNLVLRIMEAYTAGDYTTVPAGTSGGSVFVPSYDTARGRAPAKTKAPHHPSAPSTGSSSSGSSSSGSGSTGSAGTSAGGSSGGSTGGSTGSSPTPAPTIPPAPAPVKKVVKTLDELGDTATYCATKLAGVSNLTGANLQTAEASCAKTVGDMTKTEANKVSVATIIKDSGLCKLPLLGNLLPGC